MVYLFAEILQKWVCWCIYYVKALPPARNSENESAMLYLVQKAIAIGENIL
jgi:hypothetical protein